MKNTTYKNTRNNIGLIVLRGEPIHYGHLNLMTKALYENDEIIIAFGSRNKPVSFTNPFKVSQRIEMLKIIFGESSKIKILTLADQGAITKKQWTDYVFSEIEKNKLQQPTRYYAGDEINYEWYKDSINKNNQKLEIIFLDRLDSKILSGTQIRQSITNGLDNWKKYVPECLHNYIELNFPKEYLVQEKINNK